MSDSEPIHFRIFIEKRKSVLTTEQIMMVAGAFACLFSVSDKNGNCFFDNRLTVNPYPELKIGAKKFYSHAEALTDIPYNL